MAKNLTDLTARTSTADTDLMHINSGGTDYKETKADFLKDVPQTITFGTSTTLFSQIDAITTYKKYFGTIASYGHQSETGVPINASFYVEAYAYGATTAFCIITVIGASGRSFWAAKGSGTWGNWQEVPTRSEMDTALSYVKRIGYIDANSSFTMTIASNSRIAIYCIGFSANSSNEFLVLSNSSGSVNCYPVGSSSALSTSTTTNSLTITSTVGSGVYVSAVVFAGSVSTS